jgi:hypothetical protein
MAKPFLANLQFFTFFATRFENSVKFWVVLIPIFKFYEEKVFMSYFHFSETLKPNLQETTQNCEKHCYKVLELLFTPIYP